MAAQIPGGPLSAANLAYLMLQTLPQSEQIKTQAEALGLLAHACFLAIDFRLIGLDEDHKIGREPSSHFLRCLLILFRTKYRVNNTIELRINQVSTSRMEPYPKHFLQICTRSILDAISAHCPSDGYENSH